MCCPPSFVGPCFDWLTSFRGEKAVAIDEALPVHKDSDSKQQGFPCRGCGCITEEVVQGARGKQLCRNCIRSEDEARLGPLSPEEKRGLDLVAGVLDAVSWKYWKPGEQPATILDWLCLGDLRDAADVEMMSRREIRAVLNLVGWWELTGALPEGTEFPLVFEACDIKYAEADADDRLFFDMMEKAWPISERFLESCRQEGRRALVNCYAGHNRSACICVCWLVVHEEMTLLSALERVLRARGTVLSNNGFRLQLVRLALRLGRLGEPLEPIEMPSSFVTFDRSVSGESRKSRVIHIDKGSPDHKGDSPSNDKMYRQRTNSSDPGSPGLRQVINHKRTSVKYSKNSKMWSFDAPVELPVPTSCRPAASLISDSVSGLITQRKLKMELLACLVHWNRNFLEDYEYTESNPVVVGTGFSGDVLLCRRKNARNENSTRCVKRFRRQHMVPAHLDKLKNEAVIYLSLEHPQIARLFDLYEDEDEISLLMQFCPGGTLEDVLKKNGVFTEERFKDEAVQMLRCLNYIHQAGIVHRDIKPRNWVYEADGCTVKLIDFGFSEKHLMDESDLDNPSGAVGSLGYLAPEVVHCIGNKEAEYNEKCDIWSLGAVFFELLVGKPAFEEEQGSCQGYTEEVVLSKIHDITRDDVLHLTKEVASSGAATFLQRMLTVDPEARPSAREMLEDPYLADARAALLHSPQALPVQEIVNRFRAYGLASAPTRSSMLAMARSPTRLPWADFCTLRATFDLFDARELAGTVGRKAFLAGVADIADEAEALTLWRAVCGEEESMSYCEFLAALLPQIEDAFEDTWDEDLEAQEFVRQVSPRYANAPVATRWDPSLPLSAFLPLLSSRSKSIKDMVFSESTSVGEVVQAMIKAHYRWVVVRFEDGHHEFFDYMDLNHRVLQDKQAKTGLLDQSRGVVAGAADERSDSAHHARRPSLSCLVRSLSSIPVGEVANCSGYSSFVPVPEHTPLGNVLTLLARKSRRPSSEDRGSPRGSAPVHRVPIFGEESGKLLRVFSCLDFLNLALRFDRPAAILKSRAASTFDRRDAILQMSVPLDGAMVDALNILDKEHLTICPATSLELSGDFGGISAVGVVSCTDLKWVIGSGDFAILDKSVREFLTWRSETTAKDEEKLNRQQNLRRFNVVSVDREDSIHSLAVRLVTSRLQRIFLSSEEIQRIVGIVSSRDILVEVISPLLQNK